ncbi:MAG: hypothetical protein BWY79_01845 [Actinobacteria bacterium ADurb.Bin444]|nr:MAG: hypothetical protein BWY79_01845 [Actinobacteria bacterium ADurb.Bin444]
MVNEDDFQTQVEINTETTDLPTEVRAAMWAEAYRRGHSAGIEEVGLCYTNLVDFARAVFECGVRTTRCFQPPAL